YGSIVTATGYAESDAGTHSPVYQTNITGWTLEATSRRFPSFEYGFLAFSTGGSSDGSGSFAHVLMRFAVEARWLPWGYGRVEPWLGGDLGIAAADDYARWDQRSNDRAHSVSVARIGDTVALHAGLRGRLGEFFALGARGGLMYMNFPKVHGV